MTREFKPQLAPMDEPPRPPKFNIYRVVLKTFLAQRNKIFAVAAIQLLVCTVFPGRWAVVPIAILIASIIVTQVVDVLTSSTKPPPSFIDRAVRGRTSAIIPQRDGSFGSSPSSSPLVVFNLGVQFNHPRGALCPHGKDIADKFAEMNANILERRDELGLISITTWTQAGNANSTKMSYYFKDVESIHKFAHEDMHRRAWDWYNSVKPEHIGIYHETFVVPARSYETIYANCKPLLLGAGVLKCDEVKGDQKWVNTLVSADSLNLKSQWQRLSRDADGVPQE